MKGGFPAAHCQTLLISIIKITAVSSRWRRTKHMNFSTLSNRVRPVAGFWLALFLSNGTGIAAEFLFQLETRSPSPGSPLRIYLVVVNASEPPLRREFPKAFDAILRSTAVERTMRFEMEKPDSERKVVIAAGEFARRSYVTSVPRGLSGHHELQPQFPGSPFFELDLAEDAEARAAGSDGAGGMSLTLGMDRDTPEDTYFNRHFFPYEPMYFIAGPDSPNAKFQISFMYRLLNTEPDGALHRIAPWLDGLHLAYTQRSLWDLSGDSAPFLDSSYMPEGLYSLPRMYDPDHGWVDRIGAQFGFQHESNGRSGIESRSLNIGYLRMPFVFGDEDHFHVTLEPRAWFYVGGLSDNPDLPDYRGYGDLRLEAGWSRGVEIAAWARAGKGFERGSLTVDATYPLHNFFSRSFSLYLQAQYFTGYGESLLLYNDRSETWRVGLGLYR